MAWAFLDMRDVRKIRSIIIIIISVWPFAVGELSQIYTELSKYWLLELHVWTL